MSMQIKCDRCAKAEAVPRPLAGSSWAKVSIKAGTLLVITPKDVDLCDACTKALRKFLAPLPVAEAAAEPVQS